MPNVGPVNTGTTTGPDTNAQVNETAAGQAPATQGTNPPFLESGFHGPRAQATAENKGLTVTPDGEISASSQANAEAHLASAAATTGRRKLGKVAGVDLGTAQASGSVEVGHVQASESASFSAHAKSITDFAVDGSVKVHVDASLIKAGGTIEGDVPVPVGKETLQVHYMLNVQGGVGLSGDLNLGVHVGTDGLRVTGQLSGNVANLSATVRLEVDDDQKRELVGGQISLGVAAGVGVGASGGLSVQRTTGDKADSATAQKWKAGFGTKSWGLDFNGKFALGPASGSWSAEVNPVTIGRDIPKMISAR
jgi:hypothetical protein